MCLPNLICAWARVPKYPLFLEVWSYSIYNFSLQICIVLEYWNGSKESFDPEAKFYQCWWPSVADPLWACTSFKTRQSWQRRLNMGCFCQPVVTKLCLYIRISKYPYILSIYSYIQTFVHLYILTSYPYIYRWDPWNTDTLNPWYTFCTRYIIYYIHPYIHISINPYMLPVIYQSSIHKERVKELNPTMNIIEDRDNWNFL